MVSLPMKGEPPHVLAQHQSGRHEELSEVQSIDPFFLVLLELKARVLQKVYGVLGVHVLSGTRKKKKKELMYALYARLFYGLFSVVWIGLSRSPRSRTI